MNRPNYVKQQGVALISVILITAIITSMTVNLATSQAFSIQKTSTFLLKDRMRLTIIDLEAEAELMLIAELAKNRTDETNEATPRSLIRAARDDIRGQGEVSSLNSFFNLTNLSDNYGTGAARNSTTAGGAARLRGNAAGPDANRVDSSAGFENNGGKNTDAPSASASPRLCNDLLTCDWAEYAPQGFEQAPRPSGENITQDDMEDGEPGESQNEIRQANGQSATNTIEDNTGEDGAPAPNVVASRQKLSPQEVAEKRLVTLFKALDLDAELVPALLDWIDPDTSTRYPNGAEDDYYMNLDNAYRTANRGLSSLRELLLIKGFDRQVYEKLKPHLQILPQATNINVNTASKEVLMSLSPLIDSATAKMLMSAREIQAFQSVGAFVGHPLVRGRFVDSQGLSVDSDYYSLDMTLTSDRLTVSALTRLHRFNQQLEPIRRSQGYLW
ncbi:MAG: type II secretion system minor pseudopilin GspK [Gammaproteobacteria bacterium]